MKLTEFAPFVYTQYGLSWFITVLTNFINCIVGLINPREFLEYCFNYNSCKHKGWFVRTNFGWYWRCTHRRNDASIRQSWFLRNLLRVRMIITLPFSFLHCCVHSSIGYALIEQPEKFGTYMKRYFKVIRDGYYNIKEKEYVI